MFNTNEVQSRIVYETGVMKPHEGDVRIMGVFSYREWVDEEHDLTKMRISGPVFAGSKYGDGTRPMTVGVTIRWSRSHILSAEKKAKIIKSMQNAIKRELCWQHCNGHYNGEEHGPKHKSWTEKMAAVFIETMPNEVKSRLEVFSWKDVDDERIKGNLPGLEAYHMGEDCCGPETWFSEGNLEDPNKNYTT